MKAMMYIAARTEKRWPYVRCTAVPTDCIGYTEQNYLTAANVLCVESACATATGNKAAELCAITLRPLCNLVGSAEIPRSISKHSGYGKFGAIQIFHNNLMPGYRGVPAQPESSHHLARNPTPTQIITIPRSARFDIFSPSKRWEIIAVQI